MINAFKFFLQTLSVYLFICAQVSATTKPHVETAATKLTLVTEEWRPFNYTNDETHELTGIVTERLKAILDEQGFTYQISSNKWDLSLNKASNLKDTLIYTIERTADREPAFQWVCPITPIVPVSLYKLSKRKDIQIKALSDAKKHIISIENNESDHEFLNSEGFIDGKHLKVTNNPYEGPRLFFENKVDLVIQSGPEMDYYLNYYNHSKDEVEKLIELRSFQGCLAFGLKTDKKLVEKVRRAVLEYNKTYPLTEL
jgi:polar amino acid transport system substrate-binding protein